VQPLESPIDEQPSGLKWQEIEVGAGKLAVDRTAVVHYTGWLEDGTKFDSSRDRDRPFTFPVGAGRVIKGWDEGVATMKVGGKRRLIVPAALGYGERGTGPIPGGATLIFDVELLEVR
jgi:FKBP-type peptidyl-prolyl cis-trans isomerase